MILECISEVAANCIGNGYPVLLAVFSCVPTMFHGMANEFQGNPPGDPLGDPAIFSGTPHISPWGAHSPLRLARGPLERLGDPVATGVDHICYSQAALLPMHLGPGHLFPRMGYRCEQSLEIMTSSFLEAECTFCVTFLRPKKCHF